MLFYFFLDSDPDVNDRERGEDYLERDVDRIDWPIADPDDGHDCCFDVFNFQLSNSPTTTP